MGLRARLLMLVMLPTVPALLLALYTNFDQRRLGTAKAGEEALKAVHIVAASQKGLIEATRGHLVGLGKFPEAYGTNTSTFQKFFASMRRIYSDYADFGVIASNGSLISCSFGLKGQTDFANRLEFRGAIKSRDLAVGEYQAGDALCKPNLPMAFPLLDPGGRLVRVVYGALDLEALNRELGRAPLAPGVIAEVFDGNGHILGRIPEPAKWLGRDCSISQVFAAIRQKGEGLAAMPGLDGVRRLHAFTTLRSGGVPALFVSVGIPASQAYSGTTRLLIFNLTILCAVAVLALGAAWIYGDRYILNPINALLGSARRVGAGDLSARSGVARASGELDALVRAFDEMATSLQRQRTEMESAHAEIARLNATLEGRVAERTAQLAELNHQLEAYSYTVSHDLRAPLRHISGYVAVLQEELGAMNSQAGPYLDQISAAVERMNGLVEDLLAFAKTGRAELRREMVAMGDLVEEARKDIQADTHGRDIQWQMEPLPEAYVDRSMFRLVWANLLDNAVKYTGERAQARIDIGCKSLPDQLEFFVRDNGAGFDMRHAGKLFGVFQRLHSAPRFEGSGIGLATVHRIVERHGGRIWAEGQLNQGATFWFSLPKIA